MGHASKERVLLIGTDQRITSGPAAKRLHSKAGYMAAPERFAQKSDSFPLHRGRRPYMLLIGTDQRITSGPAAKRLHSKAGYMAAPERFAKKSDSFPLHRGRRPYMTHLGNRVCIAAVETMLF